MTADDELPGGCPPVPNLPKVGPPRPFADTPEAVAARHTKASKLAAVLDAHGCAPEDVLSLPEAGWRIASQLAGTTERHSDETKLLVATLLRLRSQARTRATAR